VLLTLEGGFLIFSIKKLLAFLFPKTYVSGAEAIIILSAISLVLIAASIFKCVQAIYPNLEHRQGRKSLLYFLDVSYLSKTDYYRMVKNTSEQEYEDELIAQMHALSVVASKKFSHFRDALCAFVLGLSSLGVIELWLQLKS